MKRWSVVAWVLGILCWRCVYTQPRLTVDKKSVVLPEVQSSSVSLVIATCDPPNGCTVLHNVNPASPCGSCFSVLPCGIDFCLTFSPGLGTLNPSITPRYTVTLRARNALGNSALVAVDVNIQPNTPPYFDPREYTDLHKADVISTIGTVTVRATDKDGDTLTYSMQTVPDTSGLTIDSRSGVISATRDLKYECRKSLSALVYVQDNYHSDLAGPLTLSLDIVNFNERPLVNNLNTDLYVRETETVGSMVLRLAAFDGSVDEAPLTYTVTTAPTAAAGLLSIIGNDIVVVKPLNYETYPKTFTMTIQGSDGFCKTEPYHLHVHIVDINEPPTLYPIDQTINSCEGKVEIRPVWNASDPDINDKIQFTDITPNTFGRFKINPDTGVVSTTIDYDLDVDKLPSIVILVVTVSDKQRLTATATLTILFQDCNDNAPTFKIPAMEYEAKDCWPVGTVLPKHVQSADDLDSSFNQNNVISYSGSGNGILVQPSGSIVMTKTFTAGQTTTFPVYATDHGKVPGPLTSKAHYVSVYTIPCIVPETSVVTTVAPSVTITVAPNVANKNIALAWGVLAALLAAALLSLWIYFLWRYCWTRIRDLCRNGCQRKPEPPILEDRPPARPPTQPAPEPEKGRPGFIFGWWKETYPNNDYDHIPNRDALPETSKGPEPVNTNTYDDDSIPPLADPSSPSAAPKTKSCNIL